MAVAAKQTQSGGKAGSEARASPAAGSSEVVNPIWQRLARQTAVLQAKLRVGADDDPLEREADRVAEAVVSGAAAPGAVQRKCAACEEEEREVRRSPAYFEPVRGGCPACGGQGAEAGVEVQRSAAGPAPTAPAGPSPPGVSGAGAPLDRGVRAALEPRFGFDFGDVRVHADGPAARSAAELNARAYTMGRHVVFGASEYRPDTPGGLRLLAHELTHVVQQAEGGPEPPVQRSVADSAGSDYDIDDTIEVLRETLRVALRSLRDGAIPRTRRKRIRRQFKRLKPLLSKLEAARENDGRGVSFGFDPDPAKNEVIAGDSSKSLAELYAGFMAPPQPAAAGASPELQAWALPGGLRISPATGVQVQRCELICVGVIILSGLLLAGCSGKNNRRTPCEPEEEAEIERFHHRAAGWVDTAMTRLGDYFDGTASDDVRGWVDQALEDNFHFQTTEPNAIKEIAAWLGGIQLMFATGTSGRYTCQCTGNVDAYTVGREIHLCPGWFDSADEIRRTTTVIHEMGHAIGLHGSIPISSGKTEDVYEFHAGYATMTPERAMKNTEPYAVFARQVAHDGGEPPGTHR